MLSVLFWFSLLISLYCYFGYPVLLWAAHRFFARPVQKQESFPRVAVLIAVYNEADVIERKIKNLLSFDYPPDKLEIFIGSDASDDSTCTLIQNFHSDRIHVFDYPQRRGKMCVINDLGKEAAHFDVFVFTDARQEFAPQAVKELVANFADKSVGCVSGELVFRKAHGATAQGVGAYWRYEKFLRRMEAGLHSMLGATGAIYAIRRQLFSVIPDNLILDDMYVPLKIIESGYRSVFDNQALAYDDPAINPQEEHRRKTRTLYGNYQIFEIFAHLFVPLRSPIAVQFFSHKLLRVIVPFLLIILLVVNAMLTTHIFYRVVFILQVIFYVCAGIGSLAREGNYGMLNALSRFCYVPYVFCLLNFSAFIGFFKFLFKKQDVTWQKARAR